MATFTVNSFADTIDADPGDGNAADSNGNTTLRAAIMEANALASNDTIVLPAGMYTLSLAGSGEDGALTGDLDVANNGTLAIAGAGATTIDANQIDRVFHVLSGANLAILDVTVTNGKALLHIGGGIFNYRGTLTVTSSTISGNSADSGGGIANHGYSVFNVIYGALTLGNTILAGNTASSGPDGHMDGATITSQGHNLIGTNSYFPFTAGTGDQIGTAASPIDPLLGPLQDNGGPTWTHALLPGSPAIEGGTTHWRSPPGLSPINAAARSLGLSTLTGIPQQPWTSVPMS